MFSETHTSVPHFFIQEKNNIEKKPHSSVCLISRALGTITYTHQDTYLSFSLFHLER